MKNIISLIDTDINIEGVQTDNSRTNGIKLGLFNGMKYIVDGHDIDECNDEIARLFGMDD